MMHNRSRRGLPVVVGGWVVFVSAVAASAGPFSDILIFGDSFLDTGNVFDATFHLYPPDPPYYQGRFSDGSLWIEHLADDLQLVVVANGDDPTQIHGNNFAVGGARCVIDVPYPPFGTVPSVATQVSGFLAASTTLPSDALFVMYGGANDILHAVHPDNAYTPSEQAAILEEAAAGLAGAINALADQGARYFLVPDPPDWGQVPGCLFVTTNAVAAHAATLQFDDQLWMALGGVASAQDVVIIRLDTYALHWRIIDDALNHGGAVYGITNVYTPIFEGFAGSPGADPATSLFSDDIHWSAVGHEKLAAAALAAMEHSPVLWVDCATGPQGVIAAACALIDHDADGDVDLRDFAEVQIGTGLSSR